MDWSKLPPLASLRAFAAFADTGGLVEAGRSLNVSHAAVSQQLKLLEARLGVALLDRSKRALTLTAEGQQLADALTLGFGAIHSAVQDLTTADNDRPLHISTTPTFATHWLMPRLSRFRAAHPEIDLMLDPSASLVALEPGGIDVALRYGDGNWPGLTSELLLTSPMVIVAAPSLLAGRKISTPAELVDFPWLEELGTTETSNWLRSQGITQGFVGGKVQIPGNLILDAARDGQGVAVLVRHFVEYDLRAGRLIALFTEENTSGYHIVHRTGVLRESAKTFVRWLQRQKKLG